jgi:transposase-like protein|tara:strand:+ start:172 stop:366 length:195 start_codon:yes stop_codon:yes gene_type:complete
MRFVTRREIADELRVCTATFDNWRREYELEKGKRFPGEVRIGPRKVLFNRELVLNYFHMHHYEG